MDLVRRLPPLTAWVVLVLCGAVQPPPGQHVHGTTYAFLGLRGNVIMTTSGNVTSQGLVTLLTSGLHEAVLDLHQGGAVNFPPQKCLESMDTCTTGFTVTFTFRIIPDKVKVESGASGAGAKMYVLDSGSDRSNRTGVTLSLQDDLLECTAAGVKDVWTLAVKERLSPRVWHQVHVSWHPNIGLTLWAGLQLLGSRSQPGQRSASSVDVLPGPLTLGSVENSAGSGGLQVSGLTVVDAFLTDVLKEGLARFTTTSAPNETHSQSNGSFNTNTTVTSTSTTTTAATTSTNTATTTTTTTTTSTTPVMTPTDTHSGKVVIRFLLTSGQQLLTSLGTLNVVGDVTVEARSGTSVLTLDSAGEHVDLGQPLPCLSDVTLCQGGFNIRIVFKLLQVSPGGNVLLSNGGDQRGGSGLALTYFAPDLVLVVGTRRARWTGLYAVSLEAGRWYTVDASWDGQGGGSVHVDNARLTGRELTTPRPTSRPQDTSLLLGATPDGRASTRMDVVEVALWPQDRAAISQQELKLIQLPNDNLHLFTSTQTSSEVTSEGGAGPGQTVTNQRLQDAGAAAGSDDTVVIVVLGSLFGLMLLVLVTGGLFYVRLRRQATRRIKLLTDQRRTTPDTDFPFHVGPRAYHNRFFSNLTDHHMPLY